MTDNRNDLERVWIATKSLVLGLIVVAGMALLFGWITGSL